MSIRAIGGLLLFGCAAAGVVTAAESKDAAVAWLPAEVPAALREGPTLCRRDFFTPAQGAAVLAAARETFTTREAWAAYAARVRTGVQAGAGLAPWPRRTPLLPIVRERREHDGYSVENVALEIVPGYWATGNLFRPLPERGVAADRAVAAERRRPAVLTTHGHTRLVQAAEDWSRHGRFTETVQRRGGTLARMGAVVLSLDMFGYGDTAAQVGAEAHRTELALPMQLWSAMRALDFLSDLEGVDPARLAVTGESGGGTQAFLLAALDERVAVSVPVVMVSSYFFGGCPCESGRPIHRGPEHFASNALLAALTAPRPQLLVSDGGDWTQHTPVVEFPFLQHVYGLWGEEARGAVENVHLPDEGHDYGPSKRAAMYRFLGARLGLDASVAFAADGALDESRVTLESPERLRVWTETHPLPAGAVRSAAEVAAALATLQRTEAAAR